MLWHKFFSVRFLFFIATHVENNFYLHGVGLHSMVEVVVTPESCRPLVVVIGNVRLLNLKVMRVVTFGLIIRNTWVTIRRICILRLSKILCLFLFFKAGGWSKATKCWSLPIKLNLHLNCCILGIFGIWCMIIIFNT